MCSYWSHLFQIYRFLPPLLIEITTIVAVIIQIQISQSCLLRNDKLVCLPVQFLVISLLALALTLVISTTPPCHCKQSETISSRLVISNECEKSVLVSNLLTLVLTPCHFDQREKSVFGIIFLSVPPSQ